MGKHYSHNGEGLLWKWGKNITKMGKEYQNNGEELLKKWGNIIAFDIFLISLWHEGIENDHIDHVGQIIEISDCQ